jgi:dTDP-4-amino-4,6-dideoxygalactose transaminase
MGKSYGGKSGQCPVAEDAGDTLVRLPIFSSMSEEQLEQVIDTVKSFRC